LPWWIVGRDALFVNLRVSWETVEKSEELWVQFYDFRRLVNSWLLCDNIQIVLENRNNVFALPVIFNRLNDIRVNVHRGAIFLVIQVKVVSLVKLVQVLIFVFLETNFLFVQTVLFVVGLVGADKFIRVERLLSVLVLVVAHVWRAVTVLLEFLLEKWVSVLLVDFPVDFV
jgi:hypothetical protein